MTTLERNALARILIDLIKADNVLDVSEMKFFAEVERKYKLTRDNLISAQNMDFGRAVAVLGDLSKEDLDEIMSDMEKLTISDGNCTPNEAYLVMALRFCLRPELEMDCRMITTDVTDIAIDPGNFVYTETDFDEETNCTLKNKLRYIESDFKVAGLDFVYIPKIVEDLNTMDSEYLHNVIRFLAPSLNDKSQNDIFDTLRNLTTDRFCRNFLIRKLGLDNIFDSDPSILFQVGNSNGRIVYMHIVLGGNVIETLEKIVDEFHQLTKNNVNLIPNCKRGNQRFLYYGFHRALFDLLAFPGKTVESRILVDTYQKKVVFMDLETSISLPSKQLALYLFILQQSVCTRKHELSLDTKSEKIRTQNQAVFDKIYGYLSDSDCSAYDIGITPALAKIKKAVREIQFLDNVSAYIPERKDGALRLKVNPMNVFVRENDGQIVLMAESARWKFNS